MTRCASTDEICRSDLHSRKERGLTAQSLVIFMFVKLPCILRTSCLSQSSGHREAFQSFCAPRFWVLVYSACNGRPRRVLSVFAVCRPVWFPWVNSFLSVSKCLIRKPTNVGFSKSTKIPALLKFEQFTRSIHDCLSELYRLKDCGGLIDIIRMHFWPSSDKSCRPIRPVRHKPCYLP